MFMGYLGEEEKTKDMIDEDGGLRSGDIGKKDEDGFIYITGRIKGGCIVNWCRLTSCQLLSDCVCVC